MFDVEATLLLRYVLVFFILVFMEGLLSADNALVLAVMVRPLASNLREKALFYGLLGAVVLRFGALFIISFLANVWQAQAAGALYLIYVAYKNLQAYKVKNHIQVGDVQTPGMTFHDEVAVSASKKEFWKVVAKVELADIAFAVDSILAAVAIAMSLPPTGIGHIGGLDTGRFIVVLLGGLSGVVLMRFAATIFVKLLDQRPKLEKAAFLLVGWVGIKLAIVTISHPAIGLLPEHFPHSMIWQVVFFGVMGVIAIWGWLTSPAEKRNG